MADHQIGAVVLIEDMMLNANANAIADLAIMKRLPSSGFPEFVRDGCLIAYGINFPDMDYRAAAFHIIKLKHRLCTGRKCKPRLLRRGENVDVRRQPVVLVERTDPDEAHCRASLGIDGELRACWRPFDDEEIATAHVDCCRT